MPDTTTQPVPQGYVEPTLTKCQQLADVTQGPGPIITTVDK
jgi:hypothetical protein